MKNIIDTICDKEKEEKCVVQVSVTKKQKETLRRLAKQDNRSLSSFLRVYLRKIYENNKT